MANFDHPTHHSLKQTKATTWGQHAKCFTWRRDEELGNIQGEYFPLVSSTISSSRKDRGFVSNTLRSNLAILAVRATLKTESKYLWIGKSAWNKSFHSCACEEPNSGGTSGDFPRVLNTPLSYWLVG